ncbi:carboxypeptidase-like regulatory domain-containing protein, partial [Parabacteroides sp. OttesenSCG-928-O15]|nr:carboxypeptidase-like regulatory domain-containing protein [Parabacteroides sp. OttesenSCG-928-O15]
LDMENSALLGITFRIHPKFVAQAAPMYIERKSRQLNITPQEVSYTISYKQSKGIYYINHVRGDLEFRVRKKKHLFSTTLHTWFEMATIKTETEDIKRFPRDERIPTQTVFSETEYTYDNHFWEHFNIILPEESLHEAIGKISGIIEETNNNE